MGHDIIDKQEYHESYGMVRIGRISGGNGKFFGSHIKCNNYITIEISDASVSNDLGRNWFFSKNEITKIKLTPTQFSELITTTNGTGVPCTLEVVNGKRREPVPEDTKTEARKAVDYFKARMEKFDDEMTEYSDKAQEILEKKSINKSDRAELLNQLRRMHQEVKSNIPFYMEQFNKSANKVVNDAKAEVDAFTTHIIQKAGIEAIKKGDFPKLLED